MGNTIWVDVRGRKKDEIPRDNSIMLRPKSELRLTDRESQSRGCGASLDVREGSMLPKTSSPGA